MSNLTISEVARMGGLARAKKRTAEQRKKSSEKAIRALKRKTRLRRKNLTKV